MRNLPSFVTGMTALFSLTLLGCPTIDDPFDSLTSTSLSTATQGGDGDGDTETGNMDMGDGDGDTGDGDGDTAGDGDGDSAGDGDGDTGCPAGDFNCPCDAGMCNDGLECADDDTCQFPSGDGDGDTGNPDASWDPEMCPPPGQPIGVDGIEGGFCSQPCTSDVDCPAGPAGTMPACALQTPDMMMFCALICQPGMDMCPAGSTCKDVPMQMGVGLCTYP